MSCEIYTLFDGAAQVVSYDGAFHEPIRLEVGRKPALIVSDLTTEQALELRNALDAAIAYQNEVTQ